MSKKKWGDAVENQNSTTPEKEIELGSGYCSTCGHGKFRLRIENGELLRFCPKCSELYKPETGEIIEKGNFTGGNKDEQN